MTRTKPQNHEDGQRQCGPRIDDAGQEQPGVSNPCFVASCLCARLFHPDAQRRRVAAKALGRPVPGPQALGEWRQRVPRSQREKVRVVAEREGVPLDAYVAEVLAERVTAVWRVWRGSQSAF